jgi:hypothetical protein
MISLDTQQWMWGMNGDRMFVYLPFINCIQRHYPKMNPYEMFVTIAWRWHRANIHRFLIALPRYTSSPELAKDQLE